MDYKKIDFHTHSSGSHDGGISTEQYRTILESGQLDCVAITDHGTIRVAKQLKEEFGERVIVGEEIDTTEGEIIGLFLHKPIPNGLNAKKTITLIKEQNGIVYIPHPFETVRHGLSEETLQDIIDDIDVIEVCNGRAFLQNRSPKTVVWARLHHVLGAASSDAHGKRGIGKTYTLLRDIPTQETLLSLLSSAKFITERPAVLSLLYPSYHRMRKKVMRV
jgi:predicted metal-dependent phosphoesterase TrpH